jgi:hypothetical protein
MRTRTTAAASALALATSVPKGRPEELIGPGLDDP